MATIKKQLAADLSAPEQVVVGLVERFATLGEDEKGDGDPEKLKYRMSGFQKDLTISYVFVLGMASDDYSEMPFESLASDMTLTTKKVRECLCRCLFVGGEFSVSWLFLDFILIQF